MSFKDHFSGVAAGYASFRPTYPAALFDWIASLPARRELLWDCACGNGQAAVPLSERFAQVIATDASSSQVEAAPRNRHNIIWRVATAEQSGLIDATVDVITVAQALHWFDLPKFYAEANRVLRADGYLVVWCYGKNRVDGASIDALVQHFYDDVVGPFWPGERKIVEMGYRDLEFPFTQIPVPAFDMVADWNLDQLMGYFSTWSATTRFIREKGHDPVVELRREMAPLWGNPAAQQRVRWPLTIRAGRRADS